MHLRLSQSIWQPYGKMRRLTWTENSRAAHWRRNEKDNSGSLIWAIRQNIEFVKKLCCLKTWFRKNAHGLKFHQLRFDVFKRKPERINSLHASVRWQSSAMHSHIKAQDYLFVESPSGRSDNHKRRHGAKLAKRTYLLQSNDEAKEQVSQMPQRPRLVGL